MQTEVTAPATGIETIDPMDVVIEKPGRKNRQDRKGDPDCAHRQRQPPEVGLRSERHAEPQRQDRQQCDCEKHRPKRQGST
jgi:hypothetical protein